MTVTSFALALFSGLAAVALLAWAFSAWGAPVVLPLLVVLALAARWAVGHVPYDDRHT